MLTKRRWQQLRQAAWSARRDGDIAEAERLLRDALAEAEQFGAADPDWPLTLNILADLLRGNGRPGDAEPLARQGLALRRATEPDGPLVGNDLMFLSQIVEALGRRDEARALVAEALPIYQRAMGTGHREVRYIASELSRLSRSNG